MKIDPHKLIVPKRIMPQNIKSEAQANAIWQSHLKGKVGILVKGKRVIDGALRVLAAQYLNIPEIEVTQQLTKGPH